MEKSDIKYLTKFIISSLKDQGLRIVNEDEKVMIKQGPANQPNKSKTFTDFIDETLIKYSIANND